jgi:predicted HAD superfamily Cof-like phosphohydrolase
MSNAHRSNFDDVGDFHEKFGLDNTTHHDSGPRTQLDPSILPFRVKFMLEELDEFCKATGVTFTTAGSGGEDEVDLGLLEINIDSSKSIDHAEAFDALIDLVYVAMGTAHFMGYPWRLGWRLVQRANMSKVRAQKDASDSKRGSSFDVVKPPGWKAPDIRSLLNDMGF